MNYGMRFVTLYRRQESRSPPRKTNAKKQKGCLRSLTNSCKRREGKRKDVQGKREKEIYTHLNAEFQRIARIRKPSSMISGKK